MCGLRITEWSKKWELLYLDERPRILVRRARMKSLLFITYLRYERAPATNDLLSDSWIIIRSLIIIFSVSKARREVQLARRVQGSMNKIGRVCGLAIA